MNNCPHFSQCSGCDTADIFNPPIWKDAMAFFQDYGLDPILVTDGFSQTRFKAKLAVRFGPQIGLFKKHSHDVFSIPECQVHHPSINQAVKVIKEEMIRQKVIPYQENPPSGTLRYIQLFVERSTNRVQLTLVVNQGDLEAFCLALLKYDLWHSIWINVQSDSTNRIFGDRWKLIHGQPFLFQTLNGVSVPFHPGAFSQAHLPLFEKMLQKIESWVRPNDSILELYAGVGAIGLSIYRKAKKLVLVENNPFAYLSFKQLKTDITYLCIDAKEAEFGGYDLTIVDPPRKGLDPQILPKIDSSRLIYVSCGFDSFKRDCRDLISIGWRLKEAIGYLLFPGTNHVEILALFER
jgi:tRNA/tmRNA/rRNA uracil-C5-methylase (TrmA/RlmC/RlmD family)